MIRIHNSSSYINKGCRCEICTESEMARRRRKLETPFNQIPHGEYGYRAYKCRCTVCSDGVRNRALVANYNITSEIYTKMLLDQGGGCAVCGKTDGAKSLAVDHDHGCCPGKKSCGVCVRGLLCQACNRAAGLMKDSISSVLALAKYLEERKIVSI